MYFDVDVVALRNYSRNDTEALPLASLLSTKYTVPATLTVLRDDMLRWPFRCFLLLLKMYPDSMKAKGRRCESDRLFRLRCFVWSETCSIDKVEYVSSRDSRQCSLSSEIV